MDMISAKTMMHHSETIQRLRGGDNFHPYVWGSNKQMTLWEWKTSYIKLVLKNTTWTAVGNSR